MVGRRLGCKVGKNVGAALGSNDGSDVGASELSRRHLAMQKPFPSVGSGVGVIVGGRVYPTIMDVSETVVCARVVFKLMVWFASRVALFLTASLAKIDEKFPLATAETRSDVKAAASALAVPLKRVDSLLDGTVPSIATSS